MSGEPEKEELLILRLPSNHADKVREAMRGDDFILGERLQVEFLRDAFGDMRLARVKFDEEVLSAKLVDLPCIIETHKTLDNKTLYKTGDVSQMLLCSHDPVVDTPPDNAEKPPATRRKEMAKKFLSNHGVTPPLKNVRKRRFRKITTKKFVDSPEVEKEVRRLLREDVAAVSVSYKVIRDDDKQNDDSQSMASSRDHTPAGMLLDEDSLLSTPGGDGGSRMEDHAELARMFDEVSSSSGSEQGDSDQGDSEEEEEEEEEISVTDESPLPGHVTPATASLRLAIQSLETQIEAQRLKIESTPNAHLRALFENFLPELEKQRAAKQAELEQLLRS